MDGGCSNYVNSVTLLINLSKTKELVFNNNQMKRQFYYDEHEVRGGAFYIYLGIWFNTLKFDYLWGQLANI